MVKSEKFVIDQLPSGSHKMVTRVCDNCMGEQEVAYRETVKQKNKFLRKNIMKYEHLCKKCSYKLFPPAKGRVVSPQQKLQISLKAKERLKNYENKKYLLDRQGRKNPHYCKGIRFNSGGYAVVRELNNKEISLHRKKYEEYFKVTLNPDDYIHHIDGNKLNNDISNLIKCSASEHKSAHYSLENCGFNLLEHDVILFDKSIKKYIIHPAYESILMPISLGFEDVAIQQKKSIVSSRSEISIKSEIINGITRPTPFIAANMTSVCNADFCILLYKLGAFGILHRYMPLETLLLEAKRISSECEFAAASIGIGNDQFDLSKSLIISGINVLVIDVAHGYTSAVLSLCEKIKRYNKNVKLVVGNTINEQMFVESYKYIDALKVGIAQGFVCETKNTAGCTEKQFSAVLKFKKFAMDYGVSIISDGGIREPSDVVKAIGAGANGVMCGKIFAACPESAAELTSVNDVPKKIYAGMASRYVQEQWKGKVSNDCPEGKVVYLDIGESASDLIKRYSGALRSGISYSGTNDITSFQKNVSFIRIK